MKSVRLHIERIVVEGLPPAARQQFVNALQEGLRDWAQTGMADEFSGNTRQRIHSLRAGQLRPGALPAQAAAQIVQSIRQGVGGRGGGIRVGGLENAGGTEGHTHV